RDFHVTGVQTCALPIYELLEWAESELKPKAELAWTGEGDFAPGDWCRFCKVRNRCKARAEAMTEVPSAFEYKRPELLDVEDIAEIGRASCRKERGVRWT